VAHTRGAVRRANRDRPRRSLDAVV